MVNPTATQNHFFFSQPHQPFFLLAFFNAFISMFLFMLMFKGVIQGEIASSYYHAYSLLFLLFTPAFVGFLMTTFPKFSQMEPIAKREYMVVFGLFVLGYAVLHIGLFFSYTMVTLGMALILLGQIEAGHILLRIYRLSKVENKEDQEWILVAMGVGIVAHLLFIVSIWLPSLYHFSIQVAIYLYLFLLTFTIAQRMVPFFSHIVVQKHRERFKVIVGLLVLHILLESIQPHSSFLVDLLIAHLTGRELMRWKLPFPNPNPLVWVLHIALFWIPVAFFLGAITNIMALASGVNFLAVDIHTLLLGFLVTILIGFGTRVTIGHSGNEMKADKWVMLLFYWTQVVVVMRLLTSIAVASGWAFFTFFDLSITVWLVLFGLWLSRFFGVLVFGKKLVK
ncbi:MAG: NnrS family protein [Campylobacterales bacterium]|nr:NnrS family protein [Campylobacterales bacterium]